MKKVGGDNYDRKDEETNQRRAQDEALKDSNIWQSPPRQNLFCCALRTNQNSSRPKISPCPLAS
jgi:hypothetical protein